MKEKRKRNQNFSAEEKVKLIKLVASYKDIILNKKTDGTSNEAKIKAWGEITTKFNVSQSVFRAKESLMKVWDKLKSDSKLFYQTMRKSISETEGPSEVKMDPIMEQVNELLGLDCTRTDEVDDNDDLIAELEVLGEDEPLRKKTALENNEDDSDIEEYVEKRERRKKNAASNGHSQESILISKTPIWPKKPNTNPRNEALTTLCSSYSSVNKKKIDIEDLKMQLLQEEIQFKRKLYDYQLQTAAKDLEIKNEILRQITGGLVDMQQLFGSSQKE